MARHPLTSRERRGVIILAVVAFLIIGMGVASRQCATSAVRLTPETETVSVPDSVGGEEGKEKKSGSKKKKDRKEGRRKKSGRKSRRQRGNASRQLPPPRDYLTDTIP